MSLDVLGFGALNVDLLYKVDNIAGPDEAGIVDEFKEACGGSSANTILNLAKMGLDTGMVGKVGSDDWACLHLGEFDRWNVDTEGVVQTESGRSGKAMGFIDEEGERAFYIDPGVNDDFEWQDIDLDFVKSSKILHLSSFIGESPFKAQIKTAKSLNSTKVSLDPSCIYAKKGLEEMRSLLENVSIFLPNENEIQILTGESYERGAEKILDFGVDIVAVKLGSKGCYVSNGDEEFEVDSKNVDPVDTTGAGDAFNSGFLYGLFEDFDLKKAGELGNLTASKCIQSIGGRISEKDAKHIKNLM